MPRIRTLKPDFWSDKRMVKLSPYARLFYMGMWNFALCDRGHLPDDAEELKLKILPADPVDADALLAELVDIDRVRRCVTPDGETYLWVRKLDQHQKVDGRWQPRCPYCALGRNEMPHRNSREDGREQGSVAEDRPRPAPPAAETHQTSREFARDSPSHADTPTDSPKLPGEGKEGKGREGSSGTGAAKANGGWVADLGEPPNHDPPGPAERIVSDWLASLPNHRAQPAVVDAIARHVRDALRVGTDDTDVAEALRLWQTRGDLGPNALPSLIHQLDAAVPDGGEAGNVVALRRPRAPDRRPSTTDDRVQGWLDLGVQLAAEGVT